MAWRVRAQPDWRAVAGTISARFSRFEHISDRANIEQAKIERTLSYQHPHLRHLCADLPITSPSTARAWRLLTTSPMMLIAGSSSRNSALPLCTTVWSSTINARIGIVTRHIPTDESNKSATDQAKSNNRRVGLGDNRVRQAKQQVEDQPAEPARHRQCCRTNHDADRKAVENVPDMAARLSSKEIGMMDIPRRVSRQKISPQQRCRGSAWT